MEKIRLEITGLVGGSAPKESAKIILSGKLPGSDRSSFLCFNIGLFEAQAIGMELENYPRIRPFTHDLFHNVLVELGCRIDEVIINSYRDGVFFASIIINGKEIDARPSDAIAMALRFDSPIFIESEIFAEQSEFIPTLKQSVSQSGKASVISANVSPDLIKKKRGNSLSQLTKMMESSKYGRL